MKTAIYRVQFPDHPQYSHSLSVLRVSPDGAPNYILQLVHGISEKKERYLPLMEFMAAHGAEVILHDLPGHGASASSAAELVTELLQYAVEKSDVLPIEAKSLLAGIFLDTKSFNVRTGQRTFEAAAYLRQLGAEPVEVKKLLQNDFQDTMAKYQIIKSARLYRQEIAIAALNSTTSRVLAAQAADELLNISGITASFVLYPDGGQIIISARSIGNANVQVILEPLGGGGNAATAGAQVSNSTVKEVLDDLVASIDKYYEE